MKFFKDSRKNLIYIIAILLLLAGFLSWALLVKPIGFSRPDVKVTAVKAERMALSQADGSDDDQNSVGKSNSGETKDGEKSDKKSDKEDKKEQEKDKKQEEKPNNSISVEKGKGGLDGITNSDRATDKEGNGNIGKSTIIPQKNDGKLKIMTDLKNADVTDNQFKNDDLEFYAYLENGGKDSELRVRIRNSTTGDNGKTLKGDGKNFKAHLIRGENIITLIVKEKGKTTHHVSFLINLMAKKADEKNTTIGKHPPTIKAWVDGDAVEGTKIETSNRNFTLILQALTYKGKSLPYDNMRVTFDGRAADPPTGNGRYEYSFFLENPKVGDTEHHTITVTAWDDEGNSTFKKYDLIYNFVDSGDVIGKCYVTVDATTIGLGILGDGFEYDVKQDEPASYAILAALDYYGFKADFSGTKDAGFYLNGIRAGGIADGASVPSNLADKVVEDGLSDYTKLARVVRDSIMQFQYSSGSGWMYTIDGVNYPGKGMSQYFLNGRNNHITLRFTLAYGKDLGLVVTYPPTKLSSYCGIWINGGYEPRHTFGDWKVIKNATCDEEGLEERVCSVCGEKETKVIPKLEHNWVEISRKEPTATEDGYIEYKCTVCGDTRREILPKGTNP